MKYNSFYCPQRKQLARREGDLGNTSTLLYILNIRSSKSSHVK